LLVTTIALAVAVALAGCTSDEANPVGAGLDTDLQVTAPSTDILTLPVVKGHIGLTDDEVAFDQTGALYFGSSGPDSSSILAQYDFSALADTLPDGVVLDEDIIASVTLTLYRLQFYEPPESEEEKQDEFDKNYRVHNLSEPLDTSVYPAAEPGIGSLIIDQDDSGAVVFLDLGPAVVIDWVENGHNGIIIREGEGSAEGIIGYASVDMDDSAYGEIEREAEDTTVGPTLAIAFYVEYVDADEIAQVFDETIVLAPIADVSTLHAMPDPSVNLDTDIVLQTHQRISPYFAFDTTAFPEDVFVNRAVIRLALDFDHTMGQRQSLAVHEVPRTLVDGIDSITLQALSDDESGVNGVTGQYSVDYETMQINETVWVGWDVTSTVQRMINGVLDTDLVFLITAGETFTSYQATAAYSPDFYYSRYVFKGTDELVLAPHLEITYTPFSGGAK